MNIDWWRLFTSPRGRISRRPYWIAQIALMSVVFAAQFLDEGGIIALFSIFAVLPPCFFVLIRRLHDIDKSGWWALAFLVPAVSLVVLVILGFVPGTPGTNRYGPAPKRPSQTA